MRNKRLDVLRCIAVVLVLFRHEETRNRFTSAGWIGVDLFFVLSGFLIAGLLFSEYRQKGMIDFKKFFIRRGFKIYPAFYFFLFLTFLVQYRFHWPGLLPEYFAEIFYYQNYEPAVWGHTWSLAVEEHFYILLPVFLFLLLHFFPRRRDPFRSIPLAFLVVAIFCIAVRTAMVVRTPLEKLEVWAGYGPIYTPTHERIDSLLFGVMLSYLYHFHPGFLDQLLEPKRNAVVLALFAAVAISLPLFFGLGTPFMLSVGFTLLYLAFGIVLLFCLHLRGVLPPFLASPARFLGSAFAGIGMYSYSIYLWHPAVARFAVNGLRRVFHVEVRGLAAQILYIVGAIVFGVLMSRLIEYPALHLRDRLFPAMQSGPLRAPGPESASSLAVSASKTS
jgi:peptidoglycan/LPS O-acetylase OafA/YrhL